MTLYAELGMDIEVLAGELGGALSFTLAETGGGGATGSVSLATGTHFLRTDGTTINRPDPDDGTYALGYSPITTAIAALLNAIGNATYSVDFDPADERVTISAVAGGSGVTSFAISGFSELAQKVLGFTTNRSGALTYEADRAPWYWIKCSEGGLTDYFRDEEEESEIGEDLRSHGADVFGLDQEELPIRFNAVIPLEPRAKLWTEDAPSTTPFTWQRFFRAQRLNLDPVCFDFDNGSISWKRFVFLTKAGRRFSPRSRQTKSFWAYGDVPISSWLIGKL